MVYRDPFGRPIPYPYGLELAKSRRSRKYISDVCPSCGTEVYFTKGGKCYRCSVYDALDLYAYVTGALSFIDLAPLGESSTAYHYDSRVQASQNNREVSFTYKRSVLEAAELVRHKGVIYSSGRDARMAQAPLWIRPEPCETKGHFGVRTLQGECYYCEQDRNAPSPRQEALLAGLAWYTPSEPCKRCGQRAERSVYNGACKGCKPDGRTTPDTLLVNSSPDLVMDRKTAKEYGFKVFRTGKACRHGHTGYRYVSTGACIECLRLK